jgi:hypothetical protein
MEKTLACYRENNEKRIESSERKTNTNWKITNNTHTKCSDCSEDKKD